MAAAEIADVRLRVLPHMPAQDVSVRYCTSLFAESVNGIWFAFGVSTCYRKRLASLFKACELFVLFYGAHFLEEHLCCVVVEPFVLVAQKGGGHVASAYVQAAQGAIKFNQLAVNEQGGIAIILVF